MNLTADYHKITAELPPKDKAGGYKLKDSPEIRKADLITLPKSVEGTNCSNCEYISEDTGAFRHCEHPKLNEPPVNNRMCCGLWTAPGTIRSWESEDE